MPADRARPRTQVIQGHKVASNTRIEQSVNHTGNEAPTFIPPWVKNSNLGSQKTVVHLCAEVPHELPNGRRPKPIKLLLSNGYKAPSQSVGQSKILSVAYTETPADIIIMIKPFCISFHFAPMTYLYLRNKGYVSFDCAIRNNGVEIIDIT